MADKKFSQLGAAAALSGSEGLVAVQGGGDVLVSPAQMATFGRSAMQGYAQYLAAALEPAALEAVQKGTFAYAIAANQTKLAISLSNTNLGGAGRFEIRQPLRPTPLRGITVNGRGAGSTGVFLDPSLPAYADAWATYYSRMQQLHELPTRVATATTAGQAVPLLAGPYGSILTHVSNGGFEYVFIRPLGAASAGYSYDIFNMGADSAANGEYLANPVQMPFHKHTASQLMVQGGSGGLSQVTYVHCPASWGAIADPNVYTFRDDFMSTPLNTGTWTRVQSTVGNMEIDTNSQWCSFRGNGAWGTNAMFRTALEARAAGKRMMVDVFGGSGSAAVAIGMVGWSDGLGQALSNFAHGLNFSSSGSAGTLAVNENGTLRGTVGSGWTEGAIYRVRITLTAGGATYEIQGGPEYPAIGGTVWTNITPGTTASATANLTPAAAAYFNGNNYISDMRVFS